MSTINVTNLSGRGGATPNLPDGANITGVATASGGFSGNLTGNVTGTGLTTGSDGSINVTSIRSVGVSTLGNVVITGAVGGGATVGAYAGVTTFYGDGSNLTGAGDSIAPWHYNPDLGDTAVLLNELSSSGIGITFNKKVSQGSSGTATLKIVNAGVAGTTIQSWGVSSTSYDITAFSLDANVSDLTLNQTYQIDIPEGFIVDTAGTSYVGTAWTFTATGPVGKLVSWGQNGNGRLGLNNGTTFSSPVQIPGSWSDVATGGNDVNSYGAAAITSLGDLFAWGYDYKGRLGPNSPAVDTGHSSPIQIPGTWKAASNSYGMIVSSKSDGTLWSWGYDYFGQLGHNTTAPAGNRSSPVQIPGTTWTGTKQSFRANRHYCGALKTNGTLWVWGRNNYGQLGQNGPDNTHYSSPVQVPGTTWSKFGGGRNVSLAVKTDGTLWMWGDNGRGQLGQNNDIEYSSPVQIPGTTWKFGSVGSKSAAATKTDGTLWVWGQNEYGQVGVNNRTHYSSPVQVPGTNWNLVEAGAYGKLATKTDGTLWAWGGNDSGQLGLNNRTKYSSPVQIPGTEWTGNIAYEESSGYAIFFDNTP